MSTLKVTVKLDPIVTVDPTFIRKALKAETIFLTHERRVSMAGVRSLEIVDENTLVYTLGYVHEDSPLPEGEFEATWNGKIRVNQSNRFYLEAISQLNTLTQGN